MAKKPFFNQGDKSRSVGGDESSTNQEQTQTKLLEQIKNLLSTRPANSDDDDDENIGSSIALGIIILGVIIAGFFLLRPFFGPKKVDPAYAKVEAIKRIKDLTLVKHHYETIIPITKGKREKLQFLMVAPAEVSGYIDLSKLKYTIETDSLIIAKLPPAEISQTRISLKNTKEYTFQRSIWDQVKEQYFDKNANYLDAYDQIRTALDSAKMDVHRRAIINGLLDETEDKAEEYLRNMVNNLGYRIEFEDTRTTNSILPDSLDKLYSRIFQEPSAEKRKALEINYFKLLRNSR